MPAENHDHMLCLWDMAHDRVSHRCWEHGGALQNLIGALSQDMGEHGGALNSVEKYLWRSSFDSKVASNKPARLEIY